MEKVRQLFSLILVVLLLAIVAVNRDQRLFGVPVDDFISGSDKIVNIEQVLSDKTHVINSEPLASSIVGYLGPTPVQVFIRDGKVIKVEALENNETPRFFQRVIDSGLLESWNGLPIKKALSLKVDAVSGATFTSNSIIANVQLSLQHASNIVPSAEGNMIDWNLKTIAALLVIIFGVVVSIFFKSKPMRIIQLIANVIVLGVWCGSFLSVSMFVNWISNGINVAIAIVPFALLVVAVVMPFCGKKAHYCMWTCPMGSLQELLGRVNRRKLSVPDKLMKVLSHVREGILLVMLMLMWLGVGFELMDYEAFSVFIFNQASLFVIILASVFLLLSCFVNRPYCRFVCPTGQLLSTINK